MGVEIQTYALLGEYREFEVNVEIADVHCVDSVAVERAPLGEACGRTCLRRRRCRDDDAEEAENCEPKE